MHESVPRTRRGHGGAGVSVTTHTGGSILGHAVKRTEDQELITGAGLYTGDLPVE